MMPAVVGAQVKITINETMYSYTDNPRLTEVLEPIVSEQWYWPAATLFRMNDSRVEKQREQVLAMLSSLRDNKLLLGDYRSAINYLSEQIKVWKLGQRIDIKVDYDLARIQVESNPMFDEGEYLLSLKKHEIPVYEFGMIENPGFFSTQTGMCADKYIADKPPKPLADKDYLYLIQPSGTIEKVGVAYWNYQCKTLMPGGQIYVPIVESDILSQVKQVNQLIAKLALNRIML